MAVSEKGFGWLIWVAGTVNGSASFFRLAGELSETSTGLEAFTFSPTFCEERRGLHMECKKEATNVAVWVKRTEP